MRKNKIGGHPANDTHRKSAAGASDGQACRGIHRTDAVAGAPISPAPSGDGGGDGQSFTGTQSRSAVSNPSPARKPRGAKKAKHVMPLKRAVPSSPTVPVSQRCDDAQAIAADRGEGAAIAAVTPNNAMPALSIIAGDLYELQFRRTTYIREVNALNNRVRALIRRMLGWRWDMPEAERSKINKRAAAIQAAMEAGKPLAADEEGVAKAMAGDVMVFATMRAPAEKMRKTIEADMRRLARQFPAWQSWGKDVRGFGELGFSVIVAEAGDIGGYATVSRLWKRLGLAVINGERQQKKSDAELAAAHGYNPHRRAEMYAVIADPLFRKQWRGADEEASREAGPIGPYGEVYLREKTKAMVRVAATAELAGKEKWTALRADRHARRLMTKALLRDLWRVWHGLPPRGMHVDDSEIGLAEAGAEGGGQRYHDANMPSAPTDPLRDGQHALGTHKRNAVTRNGGAGHTSTGAHPCGARPSA